MEVLLGLEAGIYVLTDGQDEMGREERQDFIQTEQCDPEVLKLVITWNIPE